MLKAIWHLARSAGRRRDTYLARITMKRGLPLAQSQALNSTGYAWAKIPDVIAALHEAPGFGRLREKI